MVFEVAVREELHFAGDLILSLDADLDRLVAAHQDVVVLPLEVEGQDRIGGAIRVARRLQGAINPPGDLLVRCIRPALSRYSFHARSNISHENFVHADCSAPKAVVSLTLNRMSLRRTWKSPCRSHGTKAGQGFQRCSLSGWRWPLPARPAPPTCRARVQKSTPPGSSG